MRVHSGIERRRDLSNDAESVSPVCNRMKLWGCRWTVRYSDMNIYFRALHKMRISCIGNTV